MDFSALNNPSDGKIGGGTVLFAVALAAADVSITGPLPFPGSSFITVPLAGLAVIKWFRQRGLDLQEAPTRQNPVFGLIVPLIGIPLMVGTAALGTAAYIAYQRYAERGEVREAITEDPFLSLVNPAVGAAAGAVVAYMKGVSVWQASLFGAAFGWAMRKALTEALYAQAGVPSGHGMIEAISE